MVIWDILWRFGILYDHLVHFVFIWYIFSSFGIMYQEISGNPAPVGANKKMTRIFGCFFKLLAEWLTSLSGYLLREQFKIQCPFFSVYL
jgi:hypothetical protein